MALLHGKQKEFLKLKKPTKDINLKVFFYLKKGITNVN